MKYSILALDASSTNIGWILWSGKVRAKGTIKLPAKEHIADRCLRAYREMDNLLQLWRPDVIAIESPVARFAKALIPQARVSGAILARCALSSILVHEVTPTEAKSVLTGRGNADKALMIEFASEYGISDEHQADALGIALAACKVITAERAA